MLLGFMRVCTVYVQCVCANTYVYVCAWCLSDVCGVCMCSCEREYRLVTLPNHITCTRYPLTFPPVVL